MYTSSYLGGTEVEVEQLEKPWAEVQGRRWVGGGGRDGLGKTKTKKNKKQKQTGF